MLYLWIGSQNDRVFLFGNGYRSASGDMVLIKRWVCHISSTIIVVKSQTCLTVCEWFCRWLLPWSGTFRFGGSGCTFHGTSFYLLFSKVSKPSCSNLWFRFRA